MNMRSPEAGATSDGDDVSANQPTVVSGTVRRRLRIASVCATAVLSTLILGAWLVGDLVVVRKWPIEGFVFYGVIVLLAGPSVLVLNWYRDPRWLLLAPAALLALAVCLLPDLYDGVVHPHYGFEKPVIYLYPPNRRPIHVRLDLAGQLTRAIPNPATGSSWDVMASPEGTLTSKTGQSYPYIYWEGVAPLKADMSRGFVVSRNDVIPFLQSALDRQGLNQRERADFIDYWATRMTSRPYVLLHFEGPAYQRLARLSTTPSADTTIRVFVVFQPLGRRVPVRQQALPSAPPRHGLVVVEWGGMELESR